METKKQYKEHLSLRDLPYGLERRKNLLKEILHKSTPLPLPIQHKDIDEDFKRWTEEELRISFEDKELPTMVLLSTQRFSEYSQSWEFTDNDRNILLNFKTITRENNPQIGLNQGNSWNIPGERFYLMRREVVLDDNGDESYVDYKMKQPYCVDFIYKVNIFTNKYELINKFNNLVISKFKARQAYIRPNNHFMPMTLENISDESEYNVSDRKFYSQTFQIKVMAYLINEDDYLVEQIPARTVIAFEGDIKRKKSKVEIEEGLPICKEDEEGKYYYKPLTITIDFAICNNISKFIMDSDMIVTNISKSNIRNFIIKANDDVVNMKEYPIEDSNYLSHSENYMVADIHNIELNKNDEIMIKINRKIEYEPSYLILYGYDPNIIYNIDEDYPESILDEHQHEEKIYYHEGENIETEKENE